MPTLKVTKLECVKTRDGVGKDEVLIYAAADDGTEVFLSGPHLLDKSRNDDMVQPNSTKAFTDHVRIRLREQNGARGGSNDLDLGTKIVYHDERTGSNLFTGNNGRVAYDLSYTVTD
jgi:hypothetical protein